MNGPDYWLIVCVLVVLMFKNQIEFYLRRAGYLIKILTITTHTWYLANCHQTILQTENTQQFQLPFINLPLFAGPESGLCLADPLLDGGQWRVSQGPGAGVDGREDGEKRHQLIAASPAQGVL